jgi:hypothetical protein
MPMPKDLPSSLQQHGRCYRSAFYVRKLLTTEAVIADKPEKDKAPAGGMPDGGGMDF